MDKLPCNTTVMEPAGIDAPVFLTIRTELRLTSEKRQSKEDIADCQIDLIEMVRIESEREIYEMLYGPILKALYKAQTKLHMRLRELEPTMSLKRGVLQDVIDTFPERPEWE